MKIRKATKKDAQSIRKIDRFRNQLNKYGSIDKLDAEYKPAGKGYYETFILGKKKWCLVAEENRKILGFILFLIKKRPDYYNIKKVGYIDLLYVDLKQRKKGIGIKLLNAAKNILKKEDLKYLAISVQTLNPALKFWEKNGFKEYRKEMYKIIK